MARLIIMPIIAGLFATAGITIVLTLINRSGWTNADMVRAVGSFFTKSYTNALRAGLVIHFLTGMVIAAVYLHTLAVINLSSFVSIVLFGGVMGFGQGFLVSYGIVKFADRHPVPEFQKADYQVAIAHIIGHIVYGMLIGLTFALFRTMGYDVTPGL